MYVVNVHVYFYFYHGICVTYEMLKNQDLPTMKRDISVTCTCVSMGLCVNQTSGYWFIVFIVIWHICIQCTCTLLILQLMYFSSSCRIFKKIWSCGFFLCTLHRAYYMYCNAEVMDYVDKEITVLTSWLVFCGYFMNCMEQLFSHLFIDFSF